MTLELKKGKFFVTEKGFRCKVNKGGGVFEKCEKAWFWWGYKCFLREET